MIRKLSEQALKAIKQVVSERIEAIERTGKGVAKRLVNAVAGFFPGAGHFLIYWVSFKC